MTSPTLAELQTTFGLALRYQAAGGDCAVSDERENGSFSPEQRIQIYRNNFIAGLSEVLEATYPKVLALVGEECFAQLARRHVIDHPPEQGDVSRYGGGFAGTLTGFPRVLNQAPYLKAMAQLEWQLDQASQAFGHRQPKSSLPLPALATMSAEQQARTVLAVPDTLRFGHFDHAVFSLWHAIEEDDFEELELAQTQAGAVAISPNGTPLVAALSDQQINLLKACQAGTPLEEIDPPLLAGLTELAEHGWITGFWSNER